MRYVDIFGRTRNIACTDELYDSIKKKYPYIIYTYDIRNTNTYLMSNMLHVIGLSSVGRNYIYIEILLQRDEKFYLFSYSPYQDSKYFNSLYCDFSGVSQVFQEFPKLKKHAEYITNTTLTR